MDRSKRLIPALAAAAIAACGGSDGGSAGTGTLRVALTDAPACGFDNVWVTVTKVRVHRSGTAGDDDAGWSEVVVGSATAGRRIDLLELQNGVLAELGQTALEPGRYSQVRLVLADNKVSPGANEAALTGSGARVALDTPSAQQSGLKLKHGFDVEAGTQADLVLDFDACRSIVKAGNSGRYNLKPVITALPILAGTVAGAVGPLAARAEATVSLQRYDAATGSVEVVRATAVRPDGTWTLAPVPVSSSSGYNLVMAAPGYASVVYTNVPVATAETTMAPTVTLVTSAARKISGSVLPATADIHGSVQVLQRVVDESGTAADVAIEAGYANADASTGAYEITVPAASARIAPHGEALAPADNPGSYTAAARRGAESQSKEVSVITADATADFTF